MSWSIMAAGKPKAVAVLIAGQFIRQKCSEPEETIKQGVAKLLDVALQAFPPNAAVTVTASGSQSSSTDGNATNQVSVKLEPIYNFVE